MFGEIMYGGHISDDWDRRLCSCYLAVYIREEMLESGFEYAPGFQVPPTMDYKDYHKYVDENLPAESPNLHGLHSNAEIGWQKPCLKQYWKCLQVTLQVEQGLQEKRK
jgi:dynein heavy chain